MGHRHDHLHRVRGKAGERFDKPCRCRAAIQQAIVPRGIGTGDAIKAAPVARPQRQLGDCLAEIDNYGETFRQFPCSR
jgi:hypothetical protein